MAAALVLASAPGLASATGLGTPAQGGQGCPSASAPVARVSPDAQSFWVQFDDFRVEAGGGTGKKLARASGQPGISLEWRKCD